MSLSDELKSHFLNLYHIALSDSEFDVLELEMLYKIGLDRGIPSSQIQEIVLRPDTIQFLSPETVLEKVEYLYDFAKIAWADGKVDSNEQRVLQMFCLKFGFEEDNIQNLSQFLLDEAKKKTPTSELLKIVSENI